MTIPASRALPATLAEAHARLLELEQELVQQRAATAAEAEQRAFLRDILFELPVDVAVFNEAHRYQFLNPQAIRNPDIRAWITGKDDFEYCAYRGFDPSLAVGRRACFEQALAERREVAWEEGLLQPDSRLRYFLRRFLPVYEANGALKFVFGYGLEITDRVLAEQETQQARKAAETATLARENFLANMSHEIRTPMNGVLGVANLLAKTPLTTDQQELLHVICSSGQHLLAVLNDVLDMAKITSGKLELNLESFNLCDSVALALKPLVLQAHTKGIRFEGTPLRAPLVRADAHRLNQIMLNLVSNAIKFTPAGGLVQVRGEQLVETPNTITVRFTVTDTGIGMGSEVLTRIFESFTQAYAGTARRFGGTGLGLSISRALVEQMGGELTVESTAGVGSCFAFELTLAKAAVVIIAPEPEEFDTGTLRGVRALLVEDNDINRFVARRTMQAWGVEVVEAEDGACGVALFEQQLFDLVLMDIQMPGMSGLEATALIRAHSEAARAAIPLLALTANAFQADHEQYRAAGMDDCLAKPFDEAELYAKLRKLLRR
jgi:signal transduction histidine kinase/CheY-like chemotaxis protein